MSGSLGHSYMMVHLHQDSSKFSLVSELKRQQKHAEMTDTILICKNAEKLSAHCAVLSTHPLWAGILGRIVLSEELDEKVVIIMDGFLKIEVEEMLEYVYNNLENQKKNRSLDSCTSDNVMIPKVKMDHFDANSPPNKNYQVKSELCDSDNDEDEINEKYFFEENIDPNDKDHITDSSRVDIADFFKLDSLVQHQSLKVSMKQNETFSEQLSIPTKRETRVELLQACIENLEKSVANSPLKVRGLPLHNFVFTDIELLGKVENFVDYRSVDKKDFDGGRRVTGFYSCRAAGDCDFTHNDKNPMLYHIMSTHMEKGAYMCRDCGRRFPKKDQVYSHIKREHVMKKIRYLIKNAKPDLLCKLCGKHYKNLESLRTHTENVHKKDKDVKCVECDFKSKDYIEVRKHRRDVHGYGQCECHLCGKTFTSKVGFSHHMENTHGNNSFPCEVCGEVFKSKKAMDDHNKRKHLEKTHVCDECGAKFHTPFAVKKHKRCHGSEYDYSCNICEKKFRDVTPYREHLYKHTGERPYECDQCEATFNLSKSLSRHIKVVHCGIRPYVCNIESCSFKGGQPYDLVRHMKSVHGIEKFEPNPVE